MCQKRTFASRPRSAPMASCPLIVEAATVIEPVKAVHNPNRGCAGKCADDDVERDVSIAKRRSITRGIARRAGPYRVSIGLCGFRNCRGLRASVRLSIGGHESLLRAGGRQGSRANFKHRGDPPGVPSSLTGGNEHQCCPPTQRDPVADRITPSQQPPHHCACLEQAAPRATTVQNR